jgi:hypothetical protein
MYPIKLQLPVYPLTPPVIFPEPIYDEPPPLKRV